MVTLVHATKKQIGTKNVVNKIKKSEIPSTPKEKYRFWEGSQEIIETNWNLEVEESKPSHKRNERTKTLNETRKAKFRIKRIFHEGIKHKTPAPRRGIPKIKSNKGDSSIF